MEKNYPEGTKIGAWFLTKEQNTYSIRRMISVPNERRRKSERLSKYCHSHLKNQNELEDFVFRLNGKNPALERIKNLIYLGHPWITEELLEDYRLNFLGLHMPDKKRARTHFLYLNKYVLEFFILKLRLQSPMDWYRNQNLWGKYLLNRHDDLLENDKRIFKIGKIASGKVILNAVNELNRFISYLNQKMPDKIAPMKFRPITKAALREHEAFRRLNGMVKKIHYIKTEHYQIIIEHLEKKNTPWRFAVYLSYDFGLRRNECLGVLKSDIRKNHLCIERQYMESNQMGEATYKPLKGRKPRFVPYWFGSPNKVYELLKNAPKPYVHPDTLSYLFKDLMRELRLPAYSFHDLRRTFITNCVKANIHHEELRLAVGHADLRTTYKYYVMDIRNLESDVWTPEADIKIPE